LYNKKCIGYQLVTIHFLFFSATLVQHLVFFTYLLFIELLIIAIIIRGGRGCY